MDAFIEFDKSGRLQIRRYVKVPSRISNYMHLIGTVVSPKVGPDGRLTAYDGYIYGEKTEAAGRNAMILTMTKHGDKNCVVGGMFVNSDMMSPVIDAAKPKILYARNHTKFDVVDKSSGSGFALYMLSAVASLYLNPLLLSDKYYERNDYSYLGVFSAKNSLSTRSFDADAMWEKLKQSRGGAAPLAVTKKVLIPAKLILENGKLTYGVVAKRNIENVLKEDEYALMAESVDVLPIEKVLQSGFLMELYNIPNYNKVPFNSFKGPSPEVMKLIGPAGTRLSGLSALPKSIRDWQDI